MEIVTLILPLEATTMNNPQDSSVVTAGEISVVIAVTISGVTAGALINRDRATDSATIAQC